VVDAKLPTLADGVDPHGDRTCRSSSCEDPRNRSRNHQLGARGRRRARRGAGRSRSRSLTGPGEVAERRPCRRSCCLPSELEVRRRTSSCRGRCPLRYAGRGFRRADPRRRACRIAWWRRPSRGCATRRSLDRTSQGCHFPSPGVPKRLGARKRGARARHGRAASGLVAGQPRRRATLRCTCARRGTTPTPTRPAAEQEVHGHTCRRRLTRSTAS